LGGARGGGRVKSTCENFKTREEKQTKTTEH